jgi:hypothetical protein
MTEESAECFGGVLAMDLASLSLQRPWECPIGNSTALVPFIEVPEEELELYAHFAEVPFVNSMHIEEQKYRHAILVRSLYFCTTNPFFFPIGTYLPIRTRNTWLHIEDYPLLLQTTLPSDCAWQGFSGCFRAIRT